MILKKPAKNFKNIKIDTIISEHTCIQGDLIFRGGLHLDGQVEGNIIAEADDETATLIISPKSCVQGEIQVPYIMLNGQVIGDVYAKSLVELHSEAKVTGDVYYNLLEMSMGASINGKLIQQQPQAAQRLLEHKQAAEPATATTESTPTEKTTTQQEKA